MKPRSLQTLALSLAMMILFAPGAIRSQTIDPAIAAELDTYCRSIADSQKYVAFGVCLMSKGKVIWDGCYSHADLEKRVPLSRESIFPLMSLSETVTAFALIQQVERGLLRLDDDINQYLPLPLRNPLFPDTPITFRMLLNHTAIRR